MEHPPASDVGGTSPAIPSASAADVRITVPARAASVALIRHLLGALAEAVRLPPPVVEDVKLAVTEACTNVVRHAYEDAEGPLLVEARPEPYRLEVIVSDRGTGIRPHPEAGGPGLGLPLISALADHVEIDHAPDRGSRVRMRFGRPGTLGVA
jgi:anti-sigma regulatory factor (Ser/Thr protein kinase)